MATIQVPLSKDEINAIQLVSSGDASEYQQRLALYAIVNNLCRTHDVPYKPGSFDETAFECGKASVGVEILKTLNIKVGKFNSKPVENDK